MNCVSDHREPGNGKRILRSFEPLVSYEASGFFTSKIKKEGYSDE